MDQLVRLSVLTPHSYTDGCRCKECYGLSEYMLALTGNTHGLPRTEPPQPAHRPVLTAVEPCTGTMTCDCKRCAQERSERVKAPPQHHRQPWEAKAA